VPESSGFYYPNRIARSFFVALDEVMGKQGTQSVLEAADLEEYINNYPPDNMELQFDFADLAAINIGLEHLYGTRGGLGFAMSIGQQAFSNGLQRFGVMRGVRHPAFQSLSLEKQIDLGLRGLASIFTNFSDQETEVEPDGDDYLVRVETSPFAWGRQSDRPVCHTLTGLIQESLKYVTSEHTCFVRETECRATGADHCIFKVKIINKVIK
jgi:hypothetical protein